MNPDVFITIAFAGIAFLVPLVFLVTVLPHARREAAGVKQRESSRPSRRQMGSRAHWRDPHVPAPSVASREEGVLDGRDRSTT